MTTTPAPTPGSNELLPRVFTGDLDAYRTQLSVATPDDLAGRRIGAYTIHRTLGSGGMGNVYLATRDSDPAPVALKVARTDRGDSATLVRRLRNEAEALRGLHHPNVARLVDSGEVDGVFYIATRSVEGLDLLDWARTNEPNARAALEMAERLADALDACHARRVLHRDLSPSNVVVGAGGEPVLVDFGLGLDLDQGQLYSELTKTGHVAGKYAYLPPESRDGARATERWDTYAFGGCLYALWARQEFDPRQLHELYPAPGSRDDLSTRKLKLIARKCLARRPEHRFANAAQLRDAIHRALHPAPPWHGYALVGAACALILGLFALAQWAGAPADGAPVVRAWSHVLHLGLVTLFWVRAVRVRHRGDHTLEFNRFMPAVWATFAAYYAFNVAITGTGARSAWLQIADATISNVNGACLFLAFCALWFPTRAGADRTFRRARAAIATVFGGLLAAGVWAGAQTAQPGDPLIMQAVHLPSSLFVGAGLCTLALGLGQKTLQVPLVALLVLVLYGLVQLLYPVFGWIESRSGALLIATYGLGMIGKLALFLAVESMLASWSLFGYEGELSAEW